MRLTQFDKNIISLLSNGHSQKEVARDLKTTTKIISNRLRYARAKTGAKSVIQLVVMALNITQ